MASGTIYGSTGNKYIDSKIEWSSTPNANANTSSVTAALYYKRNNTGFTTSGRGTFSITIDGQKTIQNVVDSLNITGDAWEFAMSTTKTVTHNTDGTKIVVISATGSIPNTTLTSTLCSSRVQLDTIARASTITAAYAVTLGSRCKLVWTPASASYYYKVRFSIGTWSFTTEAFKPGVTTAYTYTGYPIPYEVAEQFPNAENGSMTATLYTYSDNGITQVGNASQTSFLVALPENEATMPAIGMTLSAVTPYEKFKDLYLQGISRVKASFIGEGKYGASIVAYSLQAEGKRYSEPVGATSYTSDILVQSGEATITGFVSDSRWFGNNVSEKINVIAYEAPYISPSSGYTKVICERCTSGGTADDSGTYLHVKGKRNYTKINTDGIVNNCLVKCRYKPEGREWIEYDGDVVSVTATEDDFDVVLSGIVSDPKVVYDVELSITDDTELRSTMVFRIPSEEIAFHLREGGRGAAFGKYAQIADLFECLWDAKFHKGISIHELPVADFVVETGNTDIWYYRKWYSGKVECWGRRTVSVNISTQWGSVYYGIVDACAFPSGLFTDAPMCQVTAEFGGTLQAAWTSISGKTTKDSAPSVMFCRPMMEEAGYDILYYAIGTWK